MVHSGSLLQDSKKADSFRISSRFDIFVIGKDGAGQKHGRSTFPPDGHISVTGSILNYVIKRDSEGVSGFVWQGTAMFLIPC
jgi:hypothetical protein